MQIHQGEHDGVEHREHLGHRREADAAVILPQSYIAAPVETIFYGPMRTNQLRQTLRGAALGRKTRPPIDHLNTALLFALAFALRAVRPVPPRPSHGARRVIEIRTGGDLTSFQTAMAFLDLFKRLPGAPISLLVFKKEFQIRASERGIVFDEHDHVAPCSVDQAPKFVIALSRVAGQNAPFAQHLA